MFETLSQSLQTVIRRLSGRGSLSESDVDEALREVRTALLGADVAVPVAKAFCARVREKAVGQEILKSVQPGQQVVKIVHDELVALMGGKPRSIPPAAGRPTVVLVAGLQGSGKTTTCAKLALALKRKGRRPLLVAADLQRPAAIDQLETLGKQIDVPVHAERGPARAPKVCQRGVERAVAEGRDVVILDTAGRLHVDVALMDEVKDVAAKTAPDEVLLVLDAMTGQDAVVSAKAFDAALPLTGVILTKLDGDARGGAALTLREATGKPIRFAGVGEKLDALEEFDPARMAGRILGMGDVVALVERAQQHLDASKSEAAMQKAFSGTLTLDDFLDQMNMVEKMGGLKDVLSLLPGAGDVGAAMEKAGLDEKFLARKKAVVLSMTPEERADPDGVDGSRRRRIARGSGTEVQDVNRLLKEFKDARDMMKKMGSAQGGALGRMMGRGREKRKAEQFRRLRSRGWTLRPGGPGA